MRILVFILWLLLGLFYYYVANNCCCVDTDKGAVLGAASSSDQYNGISSNNNKNAVVSNEKETLVGFDCDDDKPKLSARWNKYLDSLVTSLKDNEILQIKGYQFQDEREDLALSRAKNVREFFNLADDKIRVVEGNYTKDCEENLRNDLITFRALRNTLKIKEVDDRTIVYFPFASTQKLSDAEVEAYLDEVVDRVKKSGERIRILGHTDNVGSPDANLRLGQGRADAIKNYLLSKGISSSKIISESKGEAQPIADNATEKGRADNRRAELQIIK